MVALIRALLIVFIASIISILFAIASGLWPLAAILFAALVITGIYLQPKIGRKWEAIRGNFKQDKKFEVVEYSDDSNIPSVEYPDDEEIKAYEKETGTVVGEPVGKKAKTKKGGHEVDKAIKELMEKFNLDKKRASILYSGGYTTIKDFKKATVEDIASLDGITPTIARRIISRTEAE
jgi:excinuclease UvrABC nuclease subunit